MIRAATPERQDLSMSDLLETARSISLSSLRPVATRKTGWAFGAIKLLDVLPIVVLVVLVAFFATRPTLFSEAATFS